MNKRDKLETFRHPCMRRSTAIEELYIQTRTHWCLKNYDIITVGQACDMSLADLLSINNFGQATLEDLITAIQSNPLGTKTPSILSSCLERLRKDDWRQFDIISMRLRGMRLKRIGDNVGLSPDRIRQIICKFEAQLKEATYWVGSKGEKSEELQG